MSPSPPSIDDSRYPRLDRARDDRRAVLRARGRRCRDRRRMPGAESREATKVTTATAHPVAEILGDDSDQPVVIHPARAGVDADARAPTPQPTDRHELEAVLDAMALADWARRLDHAQAASFVPRLETGAGNLVVTGPASQPDDTSRVLACRCAP